jgi:hypothetical protein
MYGKAAVLRNFALTLFDLGVVEFFHTAALQAHQMVMMSVAGKLEYCLATLKMVAFEQTGLLKLR